MGGGREVMCVMCEGGGGISLMCVWGHECDVCVGGGGEVMCVRGHVVRPGPGSSCTRQ